MSGAVLGARLDAVPRGRFHRRLVFALAGMILFEWVETSAFSFAAPALREQWGMSLGTLALIIGISSLGAFLGGLLGGILADRIGRRRTMLLFNIGFVIAAACLVLVQTPAQLIVVRTIAQTCIQGMAIVTLSEFVPAESRGRLQTYKATIGALGIPIAAWVGYLLVPHYDWGWRALFGLGIFAAAFALLIWLWVPESPRWLLSQGRHDDADRVIAWVEADETVIAPRVAAVASEPRPAGAPRVRRKNSFRTLLSGEYRRRFVVVAVMWICGLLGYSAFNTWVPTLLTENGVPLQDSLLLAAILGTAAPIGSVLAVPIIDRFERRITMFVLCGVLGALLVLFSTAQSFVAIAVFGALVSILFQMLVPFTQVYSAEVFPTSIRATGSSTANALSRITNFAGPALVAATFAGLGYAAVFLLIALLVLLSGAVLFFGPRTTGINLETVSTEVVPPAAAEQQVENR